MGIDANDAERLLDAANRRGDTEGGEEYGYQCPDDVCSYGNHRPCDGCGHYRCRAQFSLVQYKQLAGGGTLESSTRSPERAEATWLSEGDNLHR